VQAILDSGGKLGPTTCGWHYVEGLNTKDDPRLAILWDKNRLGHNGESPPRFGTAVIFADGSIRPILEEDWDAFLKGQQELLAARQQVAVTEKATEP
jgi:hypothetical protein